MQIWVTKETNIHIHSQAISLIEKYAQIINEMPTKASKTKSDHIPVY